MFIITTCLTLQSNSYQQFCNREQWVIQYNEWCFLYLWVVDDKLLQTIRHHMSGSLVAAIPNIGHQVLPLESSSNSVVNTLWFPPAFLSTKIPKSSSIISFNPYSFFLTECPNKFTRSMRRLILSQTLCSFKRYYVNLGWAYFLNFVNCSDLSIN